MREDRKPIEIPLTKQLASEYAKEPYSDLQSVRKSRLLLSIKHIGTILGNFGNWHGWAGGVGG